MTDSSWLPENPIRRDQPETWPRDHPPVQGPTPLRFRPPEVIEIEHVEIEPRILTPEELRELAQIKLYQQMVELEEQVKNVAFKRIKQRCSCGKDMFFDQIDLAQRLAYAKWLSDQGYGRPGQQEAPKEGLPSEDKDPREYSPEERAAMWEWARKERSSE